MTTTKQQRNTSGLKPFKPGYDERRNGNGRKPYADIREMLDAEIPTEQIVQILKDELEKGGTSAIKALQEIFKVCGTYDTTSLKVQQDMAHNKVVLTLGGYGNTDDFFDEPEAVLDNLKKDRKQAEMFSFPHA